MYQGSSILNAQQYKYLSIEVKSSLSLNTHFEKCYKRTSSRLRLLAKVRHYFDVSSAKSIYNLMVLSTFTYSGILQLKLTTTQANRLASFCDRLSRINQGKSSTKPVIQSVDNANKI